MRTLSRIDRHSRRWIAALVLIAAVALLLATTGCSTFDDLLRASSDERHKEILESEPST